MVGHAFGKKTWEYGVCPQLQAKGINHRNRTLLWLVVISHESTGCRGIPESERRKNMHILETNGSELIARKASGQSEENQKKKKIQTHELRRSRTRAGRPTSFCPQLPSASHSQQHTHHQYPDGRVVNRPQPFRPQTIIPDHQNPHLEQPFATPLATKPTIHQIYHFLEFAHAKHAAPTSMGVAPIPRLRKRRQIACRAVQMVRREKSRLQQHLAQDVAPETVHRL